MVITECVSHFDWNIHDKGAPSREPLYSGAFNRIRTDDLILTMDALYLLSYKGLLGSFVERMTGIEPA